MASKVDRVDVRARLVVGQAFRVGDRIGIVRDRRTEGEGVVLSVDYVRGNKTHTIVKSRLENVASTVTAFATRAEFETQQKVADEQRAERARLQRAQRRAKAAVAAVPTEPVACAAPLADLERRVALIESTVCKYLLTLIKASDGDGSLPNYFEEKGGLRVQ
jgi:hypothetical protein